MWASGLPRKARMHYGEAEERVASGARRPGETEALLEEGILLPLPCLAGPLQGRPKAAAALTGGSASRFNPNCSTMLKAEACRPRPSAVVRALFDDAAMVQHHDAVGLLHGGQPVRDDQRGAVARMADSSAACTMRSLSASSALVASSSNNSGGSSAWRARDGDALALPADSRTPRSPRKVS